MMRSMVLRLASNGIQYISHSRHNNQYAKYLFATYKHATYYRSMSSSYRPNTTTSIHSDNTVNSDFNIINLRNSNDKYLHYTETDGYYKTSPYPPINEINQPLYKYIWRDLNKWQNQIATVDVITGRQYTFAKLRDCSATFALNLQKKFGLCKNDVLAICLPNLPEYPGTVLGAMEAGLIVTPVNPIYTSEEISRQLEFSNAKVIVGTCDGYKTLKEACQKAKKNIPIICIRTKSNSVLLPGAIDFFELFIPNNVVDMSELKEYEFNINDLVLLPFSSGTTGLPKGVMLSHKNIITNCEQLQYFLTYDCTQRQEVLPSLLPFFHIYGCTTVMLMRLGTGCKLVTIPQFRPEDLLKSLIHYNGTILNLVPPIALFLINYAPLNKDSVPNLNTIISGAAPLGKTDVERLLRKFPNIEFLQGYGMTETSPVVLFTPLGNTRYASTGFLISNTMAKIIDLDNNENGSKNLKGLGPNQTGELFIRGPQVMSGYLDNEDANRETLYPGNWLRTGDVAHYDDDGFFYITDRIKELIKVKGFQVPPAELEAILRHHPKILDAAVFGIPHSSNGEAPRALIVLRPNVDIKTDDIYKYVADRVAHYKKLDGGIEFVKEIPKSSSGKILRRLLIENYIKQNNL